MKRKTLLSLSLLVLSATMIIEIPAYGMGKTGAAASLTNSVVSSTSSESEEEDLPLTSRTEYGVIYDAKYPESTDKLVREYLSENKDLYEKEGLSDSFAYFNADKYLAEYEDVRETLQAQLDAEGKGTDSKELKKRALQHYLEYGMLEGRISGTDFDPVIALMAYPELYREKGADLSADAVKKVFQDALHVEDTTEFRIFFYYLDDTKMLTVVRTRKETANDVSRNSAVAEKEESSASGTASGDADAEDADTEDPDFVLPEKINNLAEDVIPYQLYSRTGDSSELSLSGTATTNYELIKDNLTDKYTMMVFLCGTNLEDDGASLSSSIAHMLQAKTKNMNIVLFIGGTDKYGNTYLNSTISNERMGVYYLDNSSIPEDTDWTTIQKNKTFDAVLNENTLVNIATFNAANIGDASLLSGFMNLSTDLFPADNYGLIMWNHGGGVVKEVCTPDTTVIKNGDGFTTAELESALRSSNLIKSGKTLGMLSFDACLMGSSEIAYNLHNYYNYMFGSEEEERGDFNYALMFSDMDQLLADGKATDYEMIRTIYNRFSYFDSWDTDGYSHIGDSFMQQTAGVYSGKDTENLIIALNKVAKNLNNAISLASDEGKELLNVISIARMKCETINFDEKDWWNSLDTDYCDIGEFASFLKEELTDLCTNTKITTENCDYITAIMDAIDAISVLQNQGNLVMMSSWFNNNFVRSYITSNVFTMNELALNAPVSKAWSNTQGTTASYGSTVYFPLVNILDNKYLTVYSSYYKGTALSEYADLIDSMINWKKSDEYINQVNALRQETAKANIYAGSSIKDYSDPYNQQYLEVKFKSQYDQADAVNDSFGNVLYDTLVTMTENPIIYAVEDYTFTDTEGVPFKKCKKVVLSNDISAEHFNLEDSNLNIQLENLTGYGIFQKGMVKEDTLDFKLLEEFTEDNADTKKAIAQALFTEYSDSDKIKIRILKGSAYTGENSSVSDVHHIFYQTEDGTAYKYLGTTLEANGVYTVVTDITDIAFYDYFLDQTDGDSDATVTGIYTTDPGDINAFDFGDHTLSVTKYRVSDDENPVYLKSFSLSSVGNYSQLADQFKYAAAIKFQTEDENGKTQYTLNITPGVCSTKTAWEASESTAATDDSSAAGEDENTGTDETVNTDETANTDGAESSDAADPISGTDAGESGTADATGETGEAESTDGTASEDNTDATGETGNEEGTADVGETANTEQAEETDVNVDLSE